MLNREGTKLGSRGWRARNLVLLGILLISQTAAAGPTFVVNSLADVPAGPNTTDGICETATGNRVCTLRAAIMEANATRDAIVRLPAGVYALTTPPTPGVHPENGDLDILSPMKIEGNGPSVSFVDASALSRVFRVAFVQSQSTDQVEMRDLTIRNGNAGVDFGGGIDSSSRLLVVNSHITGNSASNGGGIAASFSSLTMRSSVVEGNRAVGSPSTAWGGGLLIQGGEGIVTDSRIENNQAGAGGGVCLASSSNVTRMERTAIINNSAGGSAGGIFSFRGPSLTVLNSVISKNTAPSGGSGLVVYSDFLETTTTSLIHVTMTGNGPLSAPALTNQSSSTVILRRSIVTSNNGGGCTGPILSGDYNIIESPSSCPMTGQLAHNRNATGFNGLSFNGGFSPDVSSISTVAEAAVPAGECVDDLGAPLTTDFRGHRRKPLACDIGAHDAGAIYEPSELLGVNLLRNGGATGEELGLASSTATPSSDLGRAPYWEGRAVQLLYGSPGYPTRNNAPPGSGHKFLSGGEEGVVNAGQVIDVSGLAAQIDAGTLPYQVAGSFGGKLTENDSATMTVEFYTDGFGFLDEFILGGFTAADREDQTRLMHAERNGTLPVGTRIIKVGIGFERTNGVTNDGYADGLSVTLPEPNLAASLGAALIALAGFARRRRVACP